MTATALRVNPSPGRLSLSCSPILAQKPEPCFHIVETNFENLAVGKPWRSPPIDTISDRERALALAKVYEEMNGMPRFTFGVIDARCRPVGPTNTLYKKVKSI